MRSPTTSSNNDVTPVNGRIWAAAQKTLGSWSRTQRTRSEKLRSASNCHSDTSSLSQRWSGSERSVCSEMISDIDGMSQIYRADCSTRFARSARIAPGNLPTSSSLGDEKHVPSSSSAQQGRDPVLIAPLASLAPTRGSSCGRIVDCSHQEDQMAKSARKRRARRKKSANHGKRPNA